MKIGLYTIHSSHNVGAMLQAFALYKILENKGAEVELVNMYSLSEEMQNHHKTRKSLIHTFARYIYMATHPKIKIMERHFDEFHDTMPLSKRFYSVDEYMMNPNQYDLHLVGSDQVWNLQKGFDFSRFFFLDYLPKNSLKKSYGSSFGTTEGISDLDKAIKALKSFDKLSIREDKTAKLISELTGKECAHVVDPTLLLSSQDWNKYIPKNPIVKGDYVFFYGVNTDINTWNIISEAKRILRCKIVGYPGPLRPQFDFDKFVLDGGPTEFVNLIKNAAIVVTSSFHGLAFSINYNKKFILLNNSQRAERMESLVRLLGAESHIASSPNDVLKIVSLNNEDVSERLIKVRRESLNWIDNNIF